MSTSSQKQEAKSKTIWLEFADGKNDCPVTIDLSDLDPKLISYEGKLFMRTDMNKYDLRLYLEVIPTQSRRFIPSGYKLCTFYPYRNANTILHIRYTDDDADKSLIFTKPVPCVFSKVSSNLDALPPIIRTDDARYWILDQDENGDDCYFQSKTPLYLEEIKFDKITMENLNRLSRE